MKKQFLAALLALVLVLGLVPANAFAAAPAKTGTLEIQPAQAPQPMALPEKPAETNGAYQITMEVTVGAEHGVAQLYASSADVGDYVTVYLNPNPGYVANIRVNYDAYEYAPDMFYYCADTWVLVMGDGNVHLDVRFVEAEGTNHNISQTQSIRGQAGEGGLVQKTAAQAKPNESVLFKITPHDNYQFESAYAVDSNGDEYNVPVVSEDGYVVYLELIMPDADVTVYVNFNYRGPFAFHVNLNGVAFAEQEYYEDNTAKVHLLARNSAFAGGAQATEVVDVKVELKQGYKLKSIECADAELVPNGNNAWTFVMPNHEVSLVVVTEPDAYPVSVVLDSPLGGTASVDVSSAVPGQTVTVTCAPEAGYRVARILGAAVTGLGNNTYCFAMPAQAVELHVLFLREDNPFLDVTEERFYYDSVMWAVEQDITNGITESTFEPLTVCNRAQVVTFLWRAAGSPKPTSTVSPFSDVPMGTWYTDAVLWAVENGITNGMGDGTFGVELPCNRAQVVTFLHRAEGKPAPTTTQHTFTDLPAESWYTEAVLWAVENGVTTGATATTFDPNGQCMRAVVVTFLYRTAQLPEAEPLVSDARYALLRAEDATVYGCYHLPKLNVVGAEAFNKTLNLELNAIIDEGQELLMGLHYTWNTEDNVVAILSQLKLDWDMKVFYGHYADIATGTALTKADLLAACGLDEETFAAACQEAMLTWLTAQYADSPLFEELKASTLTEENIAACIPFLDENGEVCIAANIASPAGADSYWHLLDLDGNALPYLTCNETHE